LANVGRERARYAPTAATPYRPSGTSRSFDPFPKTRTLPSSTSTSSTSSPLTSETRSPAPYIISRTARSRSPTRSCPGAARIAATSFTDRDRGKVRGTFGRITPTDGSAPASPSRSRNRWRLRTDASVLATDDARYRFPSAYSDPETVATNDAILVSSASRASCTSRDRRNAAYRLRSRRYASRVFLDSPRSTAIQSRYRPIWPPSSSRPAWSAAGTGVLVSPAPRG